jgi:hypothetical protein
MLEQGLIEELREAIRTAPTSAAPRSPRSARRSLPGPPVTDLTARPAPRLIPRKL